jgi:hypothetical protein
MEERVEDRLHVAHSCLVDHDCGAIHIGGDHQYLQPLILQRLEKPVPSLREYLSARASAKPTDEPDSAE